MTYMLQGMSGCSHSKTNHLYVLQLSSYVNVTRAGKETEIPQGQYILVFTCPHLNIMCLVAASIEIRGQMQIY